MLHQRWHYGLLALLTLSAFSAASAADDADQLLAGAQADLTAGHAREAAAELQRALQTQPDLTCAHELLALAEQKLGHEDQALAEYRAVQAASWPCPASSDEVKPAPANDARTAIIASEARLMFLINRERDAKGLALLRPQPLMSIAARGHSEEMRDKTYFSHVSPVRAHATCLERFLAVCGETPRIIAENISRRWGDDHCFCPTNVDRSHDGLMASPGHRANILLPGVNALGVGVAVTDTNAFWITEMFAQLRHKET